MTSPGRARAGDAYLAPWGVVVEVVACESAGLCFEAAANARAWAERYENRREIDYGRKETRPRMHVNGRT
jgi:hypothetical protein